MSDISKKRPAPVDIAQQVAEARRRAQQISQARVKNLTSGDASKATQSNGGGTPPQNGSASASPAPPTATMSRLDAIKARVAAAAAKTAAPASNTAPPSRPPPPPSSAYQAPRYDEFSRADSSTGSRGGLSVGIHPSLLGDNQDKGKKDWKAKGKGRTEEKVENANPYMSEEKSSGGRARRTLNFTHNMHERPAMQAANEMRRKAALERMKQRIQSQATKAGLEDGAETQAFVVEMPPDVEFWDEGLQAGIDNNEIISRLVVHPILIDPPQDKFTSAKPMTMYLTPKEQKKMRRIRRAEEHKEEQAKIRLGLVPTPAPKIKHTNVMRVYGEMAVQDPTAVEAMVNKQIAERKHTHEEANAARQLTKEQKAEKIKQKAEANAALGIYLSVFKIALTKEQLLGKHRYKIDKNAKDWHDITGFVIVAPKFSICVVEAGAKATKEYTKLLTRRTKWQLILQGNGEILQGITEGNEVEDHTCTLLHQGQIKDRKFKKWGSFREVESETQARDVLARVKLETFWTMAKSMETAI